jgi:RNA polymerase sigma factor (sigma-70 family)
MGNKNASVVVKPYMSSSAPISRNPVRGKVRRAELGKPTAFGATRAPTSGCRFQPRTLAVARSLRRRGCHPVSHASLLPSFPWLSWRTCTRMASANRPQYALHLAGTSRSAGVMTEFDEECHVSASSMPEAIASAGDDRSRIARALESLPPRYREVIVLREFEGCSYKEIAAIASDPIRAQFLRCNTNQQLEYSG